MLDALALSRVGVASRSLWDACSEQELWRLLCLDADPRAKGLLVGARKPRAGESEADLTDWKRGFADLDSARPRWPRNGRLVPEGWHEIDEGAELWAGQNPHLYWVEDSVSEDGSPTSVFIAVAGGFYPE